MLTTVVSGFPLTPVNSPLRTFRANSYICSRTAQTWGTMSCPSKVREADFGSRSAVCRTERPSVTLIFSPWNMASRRASTPVCSARACNVSKTGSVIKFFDRSTCRSPAVNVSSEALSGSSSNQPVRLGTKFSASSSNCPHAAVSSGFTTLVKSVITCLLL